MGSHNRPSSGSSSRARRRRETSLSSGIFGRRCRGGGERERWTSPRWPGRRRGADARSRRAPAPRRRWRRTTTTRKAATTTNRIPRARSSTSSSSSRTRWTGCGAGGERSTTRSSRRWTASRPRRPPGTRTSCSCWRCSARTCRRSTSGCTRNCCGASWAPRSGSATRTSRGSSCSSASTS